VSEPERDEDVEIDVGRWVRRVLRRWYVVVATVVVAVLVASLGGAAGKQTYTARALIYLGQPFTPNFQPITTTLATNPVFPKSYGTTDAVLDKAAAASGLTRGQVKGGLSIAPVSGAINSATKTTPIVNVTVQGPWKDKVAKASNAVAAAIVYKANAYQRAQRKTLTALVASQRQSLAGLLNRQRQAQQTLARIDHQKGLTDVERLIGSQAASNSLSSTAQLISQIQDSYATNLQALDALNTQMSSASITSPARATSTTAASKSANYGVAVILGVVVGVLLAVASYAVVPERRRPSPSPA
jgi:capsular polysaccharide biosynthesis protein